MLITITVCIGSSCHIKGSYEIVKELESLINENNLDKKVTIKASFCLGNCTKGVSVRVNDGTIVSVSKDKVKEFFDTYIKQIL